MNMTNPTTAKPERFLPRDLHRALEIHPRHWQIDDDTLSRYVQAIRNGAKLPPPLLWQDEDDLGSPPLVIDGWHRIKAIGQNQRGRLTCHEILNLPLPAPVPHPCGPILLGFADNLHAVTVDQIEVPHHIRSVSFHILEFDMSLDPHSSHPGKFEFLKMILIELGDAQLARRDHCRGFQEASIR